MIIGHFIGAEQIENISIIVESSMPCSVLECERSNFIHRIVFNIENLVFSQLTKCKMKAMKKITFLPFYSDNINICSSLFPSYSE